MVILSSKIEQNFCFFFSAIEYRICQKSFGKQSKSERNICSLVIDETSL